MARRKTTKDSLDLLLDTICNTFGGIVFISILVVVLVNMTQQELASTPPDELSQSQLQQAHQDLLETAEEIERLREAVRAQRRLRKRFSDPKTQELVQQLQQMTQQQESDMDSRNEALEDLAETQMLINQTLQQMAALRQSIQQTQEELTQVKQELDDEVELRSRTAELPKQRISQKRQVAFFLREGHLCSRAKVVRDGRLVANTTETTERTDEAGARFIVPVPEAGLPIDPSGGNRTAIARRLDGLDPGNHFIAIVVWADSFEHFTPLKDVVVRKGFEYQLMPWPNDMDVPIGEASRENLVQ